MKDPAAAATGIPEELRGAVPRQVRLSGAGVAVTALAIALAVGALVSAILMSIAYDRAERAKQVRAREAVATGAEVVGVALTHGDHPRWIITYQYEVNARRYSDRATLSAAEGRHLARGSVLPVAYVASNPVESWIEGHEPGTFPLLLIPVITVALLSGAVGTTWALRRQWTLLSEGRPALARITGHKTVKHSHHKTNRVGYVFETLSGSTHTGSYEVPKNPPQAGILVPIVYHRDDPARSTKYPMQLVRAARVRRPLR